MNNAANTERNDFNPALWTAYTYERDGRTFTAYRPVKEETAQNAAVLLDPFELRLAQLDA